MTRPLIIIESPYAARPLSWPEYLRREHDIAADTSIRAEDIPAIVAKQDIEANVAYARAALLDSIQRGEAPIASHLLYPQVLDDAIPEERALGIACGLAWRERMFAAVFYLDRGWSPGMLAAKAIYDREGRQYFERYIR